MITGLSVGIGEGSMLYYTKNFNLQKYKFIAHKNFEIDEIVFIHQVDKYKVIDGECIITINSANIQVFVIT